ncbi:MAG: GGDEF domain-containing protein, partial [Alteromonas macleodii]
MFRTLKIPIGLVIALTMSVLALSVVIVNKLEHNASVVDVVKGNTATLSNALSLQLSVVMERSPGDNALFSSLFQPIKEHDNLISATLYDNDYQVISTIQPDSLNQLSNQSVPLDPAEIPFGVTQYDNVITAHQIVGSSLYPLGHVVLYVDIEDIMAASSARQIIKQVPIVIAVLL